MRRIGLRGCPYCGKVEIYGSRPRSWHDEVCRWFFLEVVRCHACMRRHYRPLFLPPVTTPARKKRIQTTAIIDEQQERSA